MSKAAGFLVLLIAIVSGLIASATVMNYIQSQQSNQAEPINMKSVVVAKEDISAGTTIHHNHFEVVKRSIESVPKKAVVNPDLLVGRMTRASIYSGEMILEERLVESGSLGGLPALIPPGMRAITLRVDDTISVGGFVQPGHHVDIVTTVDIRSQQSETVSKVILQNIRVLAVGQEIESGDEKRANMVPTVTVLVNLDQAERIALASNVGQIRLVLRNYKDKDLSETTGIKLSNLIPSANREVYEPVKSDWEPELVEEPTPVPTPKPHVVVIYRGSEKDEVSFNKF